MSIAGGVAEAPGRAKEIGANAMGIFTKNQRQWAAKPLTDERIEAFSKAMAEAELKPEHVVVHDSYLINIGNPDEEKRSKSLSALIDETERVEALGLVYLNFHPGSGMGELEESETIKRIAEGVNTVIDKTTSAVLLIESTAGQGDHVGYRFEHLADIMELVDDKERIGVCLDTCHMFAAGYDLREPDAFEATMAEFESVVGFDKLKALHINDAKVELESRKDRHDSLGEGTLGWKPFEMIMKDPRFDDTPMILETPDDGRWKAEVAMLFSFVS